MYVVERELPERPQPPTGQTVLLRQCGGHLEPGDAVRMGLGNAPEDEQRLTGRLGKVRGHVDRGRGEPACFAELVAGERHAGRDGLQSHGRRPVVRQVGALQLGVCSDRAPASSAARVSTSIEPVAAEH